MKKYLWIIGAILFLGLIASVSFPNGEITAKAVHARSLSNLKQVAIASIVYALDNHGSLPTKFSQLFPDLISTPGLFFCTRADTGGYSPTNKDQAGDLIDRASIYRISPIDEKLCIVHEQPGIWKDGGMAWVELTYDGTKWTMGESGRCKREEIQHILTPDQ